MVDANSAVNLSMVIGLKELEKDPIRINVTKKSWGNMAASFAKIYKFVRFRKAWDFAIPETFGDFYRNEELAMKNHKGIYTFGSSCMGRQDHFGNCRIKKGKIKRR